MARDLTDAPTVDPLDRTIDLAAVRWATVAAVLALIAGVALRLAQLDQHALSRTEARWAYDAYRFYRGEALAPGENFPTTAPITLIANAASFFLFGVTDATARLAGALFGIGTLLLAFGLRPFVGRPAVAGMVALLALSPTLVFFSRTDVATSAGVFALMLVVVSLMRAGEDAVADEPRLRWAMLLGLGLGLAFASGPAALSGLIALALGVSLSGIGGKASPARAGVRGIVGSSSRAIALLLTFVATVLTLFTHLFTSLDALEGVLTTITDWGKMLGTSASTTPGQFFLLAVGLYELLAILFALVALLGHRDHDRIRVGPGLFGGWFLGALVLFSLSSGREPQHAAYVTLPLLLLGGIGLGETVARVDPVGRMGARGWAFVGVALGAVISLLALAVLASRLDDASDTRQAWVDLLFVLMVVFIPFLATALYIARGDREVTGESRAGGWVLLVAAIVLGAVGLRAATQLSFANADTSTELLAQETSTGAVEPLVERLRRLSLDNTRTEGTIEDPTGGHGLSIAIDRRVAQPFAWYFRDFPNLMIAANGQAASTGAEIVIAPDDTGYVDGGYAAQPYNTANRVPGAYTAPDIGNILNGIFNPSRWRDTLDYLLYRDLATPAAPASVVVGLTGELAGQILPDSGPYSLFERIGAGDARGQFDGPRGIAASSGGQIYVVDSGNARIEVFDADGAFVTIWDAQSGSAPLTINSQGLGPTGIDIGADGLIYVTDTWAHRVVVLDSSGTVIREFGGFSDTMDAPDASQSPGLFFGPRDVAVTSEEIFVVDTGNERVQVFGRDGSFKRAFGGRGTGASQFLEPVGIAIGPDGLVYVADSGNARISVFNQDGTPVAQWPVDAWVGHAYFEPYLAFGNDGLLYATSSATGSVEVFGRDGVLLGTITSAGTQPLGKPSGIGLAEDGSLMVTDIGNSGVYRLEPLVVEDLESVSIGGENGASPSASNLLEASPAASPIATPEATPQGTPAP
jgi:DNA-binding beta-propeller fold protein YncE/4-amino-4-deoxy-L-arabinose transferase-like glycosyltransferase